MTPIASVRSVGWATVQDGGRRGFTHVGVPVSGAWHRERYLLAASLIGAGDRQPAIELLAGSLTLAFTQATVVAVCGPARVFVDGGRGATGAVLAVAVGSEVSIAPDGRGPVYVVIDGWRPTALLGSVSTDTFSRLGGAVLAAGDVLSGDPDPTVRDRVGAFHRPRPDPTGPLRMVADDVSSDLDLLSVRWTVLSSARSGVRLAGARAGASGVTPSAPMLPGAVQVTPAGEAFILGPDGGLTGGYPVIGVVATVDRDRVSLLAAGDSVQFRAVTVVDAAAAHADQARRLASAVTHPGQLH